MVKVHSIRTTEQAPLVSWVPVTDPDGRTHMEMRWHVGKPTDARRHSRRAA